MPVKSMLRHMGKAAMGDYNSENRSGASTRKRRFNPARYGMVGCPKCKGIGYIQGAKGQCCPKCEGFGFIKKESEKIQKGDAGYV